MSGEIEVEVSGGKKHAIHAGDIVFLEDLQGKGHITRILSPVTNIFIRVADGFDVVRLVARRSLTGQALQAKAAWRVSASRFPIGANAGFPILWCSRWSGSSSSS